MAPRSRITPAQARQRAATAVRSRLRSWLVDPAVAQQDTLSVALHPPSERLLADDPDATREWVRRWQDHSGPGTVDWEPRRWPSFGTQDVPVRLRLTGAPDISRAAGELARWQDLERRCTELAGLHPSPGFRETVAATFTRWEPLSDDDFQRLVATVGWLLENPASGLLIRQLPIEGVDTKWLGTHRRLVEKLIDGARGSTDLGIGTLPVLHDIAVLDPTLLPGMPRIFASPVDGLSGLPITPRTVLILENREGLYALPPITGTVAVHGGGYRVVDLADIPWIATADVVYWGDLDTHGLAILDRLRRRLPAARSLLMDPATLHRWRHLAVPEPSPAAEEPEALTDTEVDALRQLRTTGLRLEQERIPWPAVLDQLRAVGLAPLSAAPGASAAGT